VLRNPKFFETSSQAREALKCALQERPVRHAVVDMRVKVDPEEGKWFGILSLDTDSIRNLDYCRNLLPEFRVISAP
jgi:hypothetical protein